MIEPLLRNTRALLNDLVRPWDQRSDQGVDDEVFKDILDEVIFHGENRYNHYRPHPSEGPFSQKLYRWLTNVPLAHDQRQLLRLVRHLIFLDDRELDALYVDAYRRIITPWLLKLMGRTMLDLLDYSAEHDLRSTVAQFVFASVTTSFDVNKFSQLNELTGVNRLWTLGENNAATERTLQAVGDLSASRGWIVMEDFVGTGLQTSRVLRTVRRQIPDSLPIIFVPLVCLARGMEALKPLLAEGLEISPVLLLPSKACLLPTPHPHEPAEFPDFRRITLQTAKQVLRKLSQHDAAPRSAFGFEETGSLYVSSHNAPNNTLPLIHHRAPAWEPLFRRHHQKRSQL